MIATEAPELADLVLPPLLAARPAPEGRAFEAALAGAEEAGAGTVFAGLRPGVLAFAVVLEPEAPLAAARRVFHVGMAAAADALAAHCLPERSVAVGWPDTLFCDTGRIGGGRLAWPEGVAEDAVPDWLVFGVELIADRDELAAPGTCPETTSLKEEAFESPRDVVESFARHLVLRIDAWERDGFEAAVDGMLERYAGLEDLEAVRFGPAGDLLGREAGGGAHVFGLCEALAAVRWYDARRWGPRL